MAASKYVRASLALPLARWPLAEATREAMGVSGGISEGERAEQKGRVRRVAPQANGDNRVIILGYAGWFGKEPRALPHQDARSKNGSIPPAKYRCLKGRLYPLI